MVAKRPARAVAVGGDARLHLGVARLGGGEIGRRSSEPQRQFFGQRRLARARSAEDEDMSAAMVAFPLFRAFA